MIGLIDYLLELQKDIVIQCIFQDLLFKEIVDVENIFINIVLGWMCYVLINIWKMIEKY